MCELFGMSAVHQTDVNHSLDLLRPRGGQIGPHADGWGVAFYEGNHARVLKEPRPAADSRCLELISDHDYQSKTVVAHIRRANPPQFGRNSANTHPFVREFGGRSWVFAHNGKLPDVHSNPRFSLGRFRPIGQTDSEHAFCFLLEHLARKAGATKPDRSLQDKIQILEEPVSLLNELGEFNFLLSDGDDLIAYPDSKLHWVERTCCEQGRDQRVVLLATAPLTDESWSLLEPGNLHGFRYGRKRYRARVCAS